MYVQEFKNSTTNMIEAKPMIDWVLQPFLIWKVFEAFSGNFCVIPWKSYSIPD